MNKIDLFMRCRGEAPANSPSPHTNTRSGRRVKKYFPFNKKLYFLLISSIFFATINLYAHGTKYKIIQPKTITIQAAFEDDTPMANSDVLIFPPGSTKAAGKVKTDSKGIFQFTPEKPGNWILQVRGKGGHGMRINLEVNDSLQIMKNSEHQSTPYAQKIIMAICVIWGFVGTALYFMGKNK